LKTFFKTCKKGQLFIVAKTVKPEEVEEEAGYYKFRLIWENHNREGGVYRVI
jgi:hypothetical protein